MFLLKALGKYNPTMNVHLHPKSIRVPADLAGEGVVKGILFMGLESTIKGQTVDLTPATREFCDTINLLEKEGNFGAPKMMETTIEPMRQSELPTHVLDEVTKTKLQARALDRPAHKRRC